MKANKTQHKAGILKDTQNYFSCEENNKAIKGRKIEDVRILYETDKKFLRQDLKIRWFAVTGPSLQKTCGSNIFLMFIPEKNSFSNKYIKNKD